MGCRNSKTTNNNNKKKKILSSSSSPRTSSPSNNNNNIDDGDLSPISLRGVARTLSTSDLDYMSDEDYGDSDSDDAVYNRNIQLDEMEKEEGGGGP